MLPLFIPTSSFDAEARCAEARDSETVYIYNYGAAAGLLSATGASTAGGNRAWKWV